jgi:iron complex transport system substrate-binding protein
MTHIVGKWKYIFLFAALLLVIAGCGGSGTSKNEAKKEESAGSYTVKHAMGTTKIKGTPKRVVILTNEGTEALLAMGLKPVGAVKSWTGNPWYDHIKDKMKGVKVVGTEDQVNLEAIAALHPDLIIGNKMRQEKIYDKLSVIAPTVFAETLRGDWKENFKLYAKAIHREKKGEEVLKAFDDRVQQIHDKLGDRINTKVSLVRFMPGDVRIYHNDTFAGVILKQIGLKRPASQDKDDFAAQHLTKESIPQMDGDVIFYFDYETGDGKATQAEKEWTNDPLWKNLKAVKAGQAYKVDDTIWNTAGGVLAANRMLDDLQHYLLNE